MPSIDIAWPQRHVALVTINNPAKRNALTYDMFAELGDAWSMLAGSCARAVIVTGAGSGAFCSGADLSQDVSRRPTDIDALIDRALLKTAVFPKPLIAAINGHAVAGGLELVLSADLRAVAVDARLGFPEVARAIFPAGGGALKLAAQIGYPAAMDLLLSGRLFGAQEACDLGLVNVGLERHEVLPWCLQKASEIAANSPIAVQAVKEFAARLVHEQTAALLPLERELIRRVRTSSDAIEGRRAFVEKRPAVWEDLPPSPMTDGAPK